MSTWTSPASWLRLTSWWRAATTQEVTSGENPSVNVSIFKLSTFSLFRSVAARLDNTWKNFAAGLDERTTVLSLSVLFHQKAENVKIFYIKKSFSFFYINNIFSISRVWRDGRGAARWGRSATTSRCWSSPSTVTRPCTRPCARPTPRYGHVSRDTCHDLTLSRAQVHSTSKKLLYQLDHLVQLTNAAPNESPQKKHVSILLANI